MNYCEYCKTNNDGDKYHPGTCENCGAPLIDLSPRLFFDEEHQKAFYFSQQFTHNAVTTTHQPVIGIRYGK
jgi:hypothetical protein